MNSLIQADSSPAARRWRTIADRTKMYARTQTFMMFNLSKDSLNDRPKLDVTKIDVEFSCVFLWVDSLSLGLSVKILGLE